jgi:asparagine synthase (glutamine-hydrolysing)
MQQSFFAASLENTSDPIYSHQLRWQNTGKIRTFLGPDFSVAANIEESFENIRQNLPSSFNQWDYLAKAQYLESKLFLSNYLLSSQGDRVAMAHSVEIRVPFLDYRIIDLMGRVPAHLKISGLNEKYLLKKAFQRNLPPEIIDRPKHPYRAPIAQSLLHSEAATYTQEMLSDHALKSSAIFDTPKVNKLLSKLRAGKHPSEVDSMALVGILSTQVIHDRFIAGFPYKTIQPASPTLIVDRKSAQKI